MNEEQVCGPRCRAVPTDDVPYRRLDDRRVQDHRVEDTLQPRGHAVDRLVARLGRTAEASHIKVFAFRLSQHQALGDAVEHVCRWRNTTALLQPRVPRRANVRAAGHFSSAQSRCRPVKKDISTRVFLTGASGFISSHIIPELLDRGHQVLGLTRSDAGTRRLEAVGVEVHRSDLEQPETLACGAAAADAVIQCAFDHNFEIFFENTQKDERNIAAMGEALEGTKKPILITSGVGIGMPLNGGRALEDILNPGHANPRIATELAGAALIARRIDVRIIRLPQVHDTMKAGLVTPLVAQARRSGTVAYLGEGRTSWSAAHVSDVAKLYVLALENGEPGRVLQCFGRGGRHCTRHRRGYRKGCRAAGPLGCGRRGRALFRPGGALRSARHDRVECLDGCAAGMETDRPLSTHRPRRNGLFGAYRGLIDRRRAPAVRTARPSEQRH
jgi:nucleoside-diphosphate-sugar epimerase